MSKRFVSRAGEKLAYALTEFDLNPDGFLCADLGCNVGGFTDCLLQHGAARVYAVDTGYGVLDWNLRRDDRVVVMERTNALRVHLPEPVQFVSVDVGWTRQALIVPRAISLLGDSAGVVVSLIKPHYEADAAQLKNGVLDEVDAVRIVEDTVRQLREHGITVERTVQSPISGDAGNREWLALIHR